MPTGFSREDRKEWLAAAGMALGERGVTATILGEATRAVRVDPGCDHPSKIIPSIMAWLGEWKLLVEPSNAIRIEHQPQADPVLEQRIADLARLEVKEMTQAEIDALPVETKVRAHTSCLLTTDYEGNYWLPGKRPSSPTTAAGEGG